MLSSRFWAVTVTSSRILGFSSVVAAGGDAGGWAAGG